MYPTHAQETILRDTLETCRGVYNSLLHERTHDYEVLGKSPSRLVQQSHLDEKALAKAQRNASRGSEAVGVPAGLACKFDKVKNKHGSKARKRAKKVVRRVHERIKNRRHDFVHQTARRLVNRFGLIAVEDLQVDNRVRNHPFAKSISDAGWSMFRAVLVSKAASADRKVIAVNPAYTSQDCSECGFRVKKTLSVRVHVCPCCGLVLDRDTNSARIVLKIAVGQYSVPA